MNFDYGPTNFQVHTTSLQNNVHNHRPDYAFKYEMQMATGNANAESSLKQLGCIYDEDIVKLKRDRDGLQANADRIAAEIGEKYADSCRTGIVTINNRIDCINSCRTAAKSIAELTEEIEQRLGLKLFADSHPSSTHWTAESVYTIGESPLLVTLSVYCMNTTGNHIHFEYQVGWMLLTTDHPEYLAVRTEKSYDEWLEGGIMAQRYEAISGPIVNINNRVGCLQSRNYVAKDGEPLCSTFVMANLSDIPDYESAKIRQIRDIMDDILKSKANTLIYGVGSAALRSDENVENKDDNI